MRIDLLTLFPGMFHGPFDESILKRARDAGLLQVHVHDIRDWADGRHRVVDDYPFGGGAGMVMKPEPLVRAIEAVTELDPRRGPVVLMTPQGRRFDQRLARTLAAEPRLTVVCGHYEGVDERAVEQAISLEVSLGDFVLSGGEPAAWAVVDAVCRLVPGVVGSDASLAEESYEDGLLEYPHYTRPADFRGSRVPDILVSGHHARVAQWRRQERIRRTWLRRPDLLATADLTDDERAWLAREYPDNQASGGTGTASEDAASGVRPPPTEDEPWT